MGLAGARPSDPFETVPIGHALLNSMAVVRGSYRAPPRPRLRSQFSNLRSSFACSPPRLLNGVKSRFRIGSPRPRSDHMGSSNTPRQSEPNRGNPNQSEQTARAAGEDRSTYFHVFSPVFPGPSPRSAGIREIRGSSCPGLSGLVRDNFFVPNLSASKPACLEFAFIGVMPCQGFASCSFAVTFPLPPRLSSLIHG